MQQPTEQQPTDDLAVAMARAKRRFPGSAVDAAYPMGWPVYTVRLALTVLAEQEIATVARYLLQLAALGAAEPFEFSRLLGLSDKFLAGAAAELLSKELVVQRPDRQLEITESGRKALAAGGRSWSPQREYLTVPFDPITRRILDIGSGGLLYPDNAGKTGLFLLPQSGDKPRLTELPLADIQNYARYETELKPEEIVEVAEIRHREIRLRYRSDLTVVKLTAGGSSQPTFAVFQGREYLEAETLALQRLAEAGVNLTPEEYTLDAVQWSPSPEASPEEIRLMAAVREDDQAVRAVEQSIVEAEVAQQDTADDQERQQLARQVEELAAERNDLARHLAASEERLRAQTGGAVRILKTGEHRPLLLRAIDTAAVEITIVSAFITPEAFDREIRRQLFQALKREVRVRIAWGLGATGRGREVERKRTRGQAALAPLVDSARKAGLAHLLTVKRTETHQKFILCDDKFVAQGSFNWLSNRGESATRYNAEQEASEYSERPDAVARWQEQAAALFR